MQQHGGDGPETGNNMRQVTGSVGTGGAVAGGFFIHSRADCDILTVPIVGMIVTGKDGQYQAFVGGDGSDGGGGGGGEVGGAGGGGGGSTKPKGKVNEGEERKEEPSSLNGERKGG